MKYRKLPVVIEAVEWDGSTEAAEEILRLGLRSIEQNEDRTLTIHTLEGNMTASLGDFIIRGVKGETYPCKPDIFAATYEPTPVV